MERTWIKDTVDKAGETVAVSGFVKTRRDHGKLIFIDLSDSSGVLQIIFNPKVSKEAYEKATELKSQSAVTISGKVNKRPHKLINPKIPTGSVELEAKDISILSQAETLPFDMDQEELHLELPTLLDYRSLTLRHPKVKDIFKVQAAIAQGFRNIAEKLGCTEIFVPTIVVSATEGGAEVFKVSYYDHSAYMSQSPQLYKQMLVPVLERVYTIAHAYRAEPSVTTRHLSESTQMDCEFGFVTFEDLLDLLEEVGVATLEYVEEACGDILKAFGSPRFAGEAGKIPRFTLREAQDIVFQEFGRDVRNEKDLSPQDEIDICTWGKKIANSDLVTITHFPLKTKPFYTMPDSKDPTHSLSYDLLFRGVEILSGSQRVNDYAQLVAAIKAKGMNPQNFDMYLQAFKYGMPPEGGFSFGLERMTMKLCNLSNIRQASLFPRDMERVDIRLKMYEGKKA